MRKHIPKIIWDEKTKSHIKNLEYKQLEFTTAIIFIIIIIGSLYIFTRDKTTVNNRTLPTQKTIALAPDVKYEIIRIEKDNRGYTNRLIVYVSKSDSVKKLNDHLLLEFKSDSAVTFQVFYFDTKKSAKIYFDKLFDKNVSDSQFRKVNNHMVGWYEWTAWNGEKLLLGKEARNY